MQKAEPRYTPRLYIVSSWRTHAMRPYGFGRATARPYSVFSPRTHSMRPYSPFRGLGGFKEQGGRIDRSSGRRRSCSRRPS